MRTDTLSTPVSVRWSFVLRTLGICLPLALGVALAVFGYIPSFLNHGADSFGYDWWSIFRPAILSGAPYSVSGFFSPPWVIALLAPFAILPVGADLFILAAASVAAWIFALRKLQASWVVVALMLMTPQIWWSLWFGNNDFLVPLGLVLPSQIGLFFILAKPQAGAAIALFWLVEAWRRNGWSEVARVFAPISIVSLLACIPFGFWPAHLFGASDMSWNIAQFPTLVPVGVILVYRAIRDRRQGLAILSGPFIAPYVGIQSLPIAIIGLLPSNTEIILAILGLWFLWFIPVF